jgi:low affinity Fe/Cu permease
MVFVIQTTQNRDSKAIHLKLDELIRAQVKARNVFADLEDASEDELKRFAEEFRKLREADAGRSRVDAADDAVQRAIGRHKHPRH